MRESCAEVHSLDQHWEDSRTQLITRVISGACVKKVRHFSLFTAALIDSWLNSEFYRSGERSNVVRLCLVSDLPNDVQSTACITWCPMPLCLWACTWNNVHRLHQGLLSRSQLNFRPDEPGKRSYRLASLRDLPNMTNGASHYNDRSVSSSSSSSTTSSSTHLYAMYLQLHTRNCLRGI
jgi:hypothetical protein